MFRALQTRGLDTQAQRHILAPMKATEALPNFESRHRC